MKRIAIIHCIIGVLVFMSVVQAQDTGGTPGVDYPNYFTIPETSFKCSEQKYNPGFYADLESKCQAFHFCYQDRQESFLCPTGTIFNQAVLTCDVWYKSNCSLAPLFYSVNVGPVMERAGKNLPMLLRLRNRSQKPSTQKPNVLEKSSLYETDNETRDRNTSEDVSEEFGDKGSINSSATDLNSNEKLTLNTEESDSENAGENFEAELSNENTEEADTNLVYDSVGNGYEDHGGYDAEWQDVEPVNDEFNQFYDYKHPDYESGESQQQYISENEQFEDFPENLEYPDFTKRSFQGDGTSRRNRRKSMYVVLDDEHDEYESGETNKLHTPESSNIFPESETIEGNMNLTSESVDHVNQSSESFPHQTGMPSNLFEPSTETKMTEFDSMFTELVEPNLENEYRDVHEPTYQQTDQDAFSQSEMDGVELDTQDDDETIYIENDIESDAYSPYVSEYEDEAIVSETNEAYEESYPESSDQADPNSDTEDTFVIIPDEYDNVVDSVSNEDLEFSDYPENVYRTDEHTDRFPVADYGTYENNYYNPNMNYPSDSYQDHDFNTEMYQDSMSYDPRYSYQNYELQEQLPSDYEMSDLDTESLDDSESFQYTEAEVSVTDNPLELPVTEADLEDFSTEDFDEVPHPEQDFMEVPEQESNKPEDVYYVFDFDEQSTESNETKADENIELKEESSVEEIEHEQNSATEEMDKLEDASPSTKYVSLDQSTEPLVSAKVKDDSSDSVPTKDEKSSDAKPISFATKLSTSSDSSSEQKDKYTQSETQRFTSFTTPSYTPNMGSFDFSTDSRFLNNVGYSESMDFGPYGFGPEMGQTFGMMDSIQQSQASNQFLQRLGQTEQPKISPLSAIQEKMRTMKQGKFGAFKKYMSLA